MKPPKSSDELNREKRLLEKQIAALEQDLGDFESELKEFRPRSLADHQLETLSHAINDAPARTSKEFLSPLWMRLIGLGSIAAAVVFGMFFISWSPLQIVEQINQPIHETTTQLAMNALSSNSDLRSEPEKIPKSKPDGLSTSLDSRSEFIDIVDDGIVTLADNRSMRQLRTVHLDTVVWSNPETQSTTEVTFPREETILIPISAL